MICCAVGLFLIAQWLVWYRAARRFLARWRWAIAAGLLLLGAQTTAFAWHWWPVQHDTGITDVTLQDATLLLASGPLCGQETTR